MKLLMTLELLSILKIRAKKDILYKTYKEAEKVAYKEKTDLEAGFDPKEDI